MSRTTLFRSLTLLVCCVLLWPVGRADAQGVTTGAITGTVKDPQGQVVPGASVTVLHEPSGTNYEGFTQADGRYFIPAVRVGGPFKVTASLPGFSSEVKTGVTVSLGVSTDLDFTLYSQVARDDIMIALLEAFAQPYRGLRFQLDQSNDWYVADESCGPIHSVRTMTIPSACASSCR